ncbi:MAG: inorganic diphosphatase [Clostridia bacterium]|nr:inorganic diphosphatase [Clostridia bacterium]MDD4686299.1 inorganic diphosphatase [Clostridia bacterium]
MNVWTDIDKKRIKPNNFLVFIEIEKGSKNKYELDKETGLIILDRVLYTATHYPMNYGFIPRTLCDDGDPLDVFVLCSQAIQSGRLVQCYPIGIINMTDQSEQDEKVIAIPFGDPIYNLYTDITKLPKNLFDELSHFLSVYKQLEQKKVEMGSIEGHTVAIKQISASMKKFDKEILGIKE